MAGNATDSNCSEYSSSNSSSLPPTEDDSFWFPGKNSPYGATQAVIIGFLLLCIIVGTIVGNVLVCIAVCIVRKLRRPCNYLLVSLAVSDLCVAILVMPMALLYELLGVWNFGPIMCNLWVSFDVLSCTASILNLCMISVDRYYAITKPLEYGVKRTPRRMILCVSLVWLGAGCISLPPLLILGNEYKAGEGENLPSCSVCQNFAYQIYATLLSFYIPLTVMIVVYYKIFRAARRIVLEERRAQSHLETQPSYLQINVAKNGVGGAPETRVVNNMATLSTTSSPAARQPHRCSTTSTNTTCSGYTGISTRCFTTSAPRRSNESQCPMLQQSTHPSLATTKTTTNHRQHHPPFTNSTQHKKLRFVLAKERKASTTLGIIMSSFTICWLPFFVLALIRPFVGEGVIPQLVLSLFLWLGYANSLFNPIIYATLNRDFRKPFQEILYFRCGSLNHMMREEFYQSQYGDPEQYCVINSGPVVDTVVRVGGEETGDELGDEEYDVVNTNTNSRPDDESFL